MIRSSVDHEKGLTVHVCTGHLTAQEIIDEIKSFYDGAPTPDNLWDFRNVDVSGIAGVEIERIARFAQSYSPPGRTGKAAIVAPESLVYGLSRMYEAYIESDEKMFQIQIFRSLEDAESWLGTKVTDDKNQPRDRKES